MAKKSVEVPAPKQGIGAALGTFAWRFFTGNLLFMSFTELQNDSTWTKPAKRGHPRHMTPWLRMSRLRRAKIRNMIFWPSVILIYCGFRWTSYTITFLCILAPLIIVKTSRRARRVFMMPVKQGTIHGEFQHWVARPWTRRLFHRKPIPGVALNPITEADIPAPPNDEWTAEVILNGGPK